MKRDLSAALEAAALSPLLRPAFLFEMDTTEGTVRVWDGIGPLVWGDKTFTGIGSLGTISSSEETDEVKANGITVTMSGLPTAQISFMLGTVSKSRFRTAALYIAALDEGGQLVGDPYVWFGGRVDTGSINDGTDNTCTIQIELAHENVDLERANIIRYDDVQQKRRFNGDRGLEYLISLQNKTLKWGSRQ